MQFKDAVRKSIRSYYDGKLPDETMKAKVDSEGDAEIEVEEEEQEEASFPYTLDYFEKLEKEMTGEDVEDDDEATY